MVTGLWGKKIGMTQVFDKEKVIPVTVIDLGRWIVTNVKTKDRDGYDAVQVGCVKERFVSELFSPQWLKDPKKYFSIMKEIDTLDTVDDLSIGKPAKFYSSLKPGDAIDVAGTTKGHGFAGVVKRHRFSGPPGSHGSTMGKRPGSIGHMRAQGKVIKGKRLPGHMGADKRVVRGLEVVSLEPEKNLMIIKGSVPGKAGSLLFVKKA